MWGVGIMYIFIGLTPLLIKYSNGNIDKKPLPIYKNMLLSGFMIELLFIVSLFINNPLSTILPVLPVLFVSLWMVNYINKNLLNKKSEVDER